MAAVVWFIAASACAQRVQFPSPVPEPAYAPAPSAAPTATFQGTIQPATSTWDPYAAPSLQAPGQFAAPPQGYYAPPPQTTQPIYPDGTAGVVPPGYQPPPSRFNQVMRLVQEVRVQDTWLFGNGGDDDLGVNTLETSATLAFPFFYQQAPLLVTPGAAVHWWDGPSDEAEGSPDLPPRTYDVFVDTAWHPGITERLSVELGFRVGAYSDFDNISSDSLRYMWRVIGVLAYSPTTTFKLGVIDIDRNNTGLLPAGGVIYTPTPDVRYEIVIPRPKVARRLTTLGNTNLWGYVAGEYGGGSWTIEREEGFDDSVDYNDLRLIFGLEWLPETVTGVRGLVEVGYVFSRELEYESGDPEEFDPSDTFMLRAGLNY